MNAPLTIADYLEQSLALERAGELAAAIRAAQGAIAQAREQKDADGEAAALATLARAHLRLGHYGEAARWLDTALALASPDSPARADALLSRGICASETDDLSTAEDYFLRAIDLSRQIGSDRVLARGLHTLSAGIYMPRGQFALSLAADEEALRVALDRELPELVWTPLATLCWVCWLTGQRRRSETLLAELRRAALPGSVAEGYWHFVRASLALEDGAMPLAAEGFAALRSLAETNGAAELKFFARLGMSRLQRQTGDAPSAQAWAADALSIVERIGYRHLQGMALIERARAAWALGDLAAAEVDFRSAMAILAPLRLDYDLACAALLLAALLQQNQDPEAPQAWGEAVRRIHSGGFHFLLDRERALAYPLVAAHLSDPASAPLLEHLLRVAPAPLVVTTLGSFTLRAGPRKVDQRLLRQRKAGELLALLLLSPGHCLSFDQLAEALWPDKDPARALSLFHQATSTLRRALEPDLPDRFPSRYLQVEEGQVSLHLPPDSAVDFVAFEDCCRKGEWEAALALYGGEWLSEYCYADWSALPRQRFSQMFQRALLAAGEERLAVGCFAETLEACQRLLALEPWQEQAVLLGMRACVGMNDLAGARRLYRRLEKALHEELGVVPQQTLRDFYRSL